MERKESRQNKNEQNGKIFLHFKKNFSKNDMQMLLVFTFFENEIFNSLP